MKKHVVELKWTKEDLDEKSVEIRFKGDSSKEGVIGKFSVSRADKGITIDVSFPDLALGKGKYKYYRQNLKQAEAESIRADPRPDVAEFTCLLNT